MDVSTATEDYQASLVDLTFNSKPHINALTMLAEEYMEFAEDIVKLIEARIHKVPDEGRLPVMYLMDSIVKNVGGNYKPHFAKNLVKTFMKVFVTGADKTKMSLYKLRTTWDDYFPLKRLYELDNEVKKFDPNWPVKDLPAHLHDKQTKSIHVNPKFLNKGEVPTPVVTPKSVSASENDLAQDLINKKKQLLELQSQKLMLELEQTKQQLAMRERRKQVQQTDKKDPRSKAINREATQVVKQNENAKNVKVTLTTKTKKTDSPISLSQRFGKGSDLQPAKKSPELKPKKSPKRAKTVADKTDMGATNNKTKTTKKNSPKIAHAAVVSKKEVKEKNFTSVSPKVVREMNRIPKKRPSNQDSSTPPKKSSKPNSTNVNNKRSISPADDRKREREPARSSSNSPRFSSESDTDGRTNKPTIRPWKPPASKRPRPQNRPRARREEVMHAQEQQRRISIEDDIQIPKELSLSHQREILQQADIQLRSGQVTHEQHQEILRQLHQLFELQRVQSHPDDEQDNYMDPRRQRPGPRRNSAGDPQHHFHESKIPPRRSAGSNRRPPPPNRDRDPRRYRIENTSKVPPQTYSPSKGSDSETPVLEEPEDYIIASMSPSVEAYQKHSIGLKKVSSEADRAYLEHKKKILVSTYNKQLSNSKTDSSGVESEDKVKSDVSEDTPTRENKDNVVVSPSLPLKKRKYKSAEIDMPKPINNVANDKPKNQSQPAKVIDQNDKSEKDEAARDVNRSMTPPPMPDMSALKDPIPIADVNEKERSSSLPIDDFSVEENFKSINPDGRRKKKFRGRPQIEEQFDHDMEHVELMPEYRNRSEERARSVPEDSEEEMLFRPLMEGPRENMGWNQELRGPRPRIDGPRRGMWPQRGHPHMRGEFRGDRRMMERRMRSRGPRGPGPRPPPGWVEERQWQEMDGPRMRRGPEMRRGPNVPRMRRPMGRSPPRRRMERFPQNMEWHGEFQGQGRGRVPPQRDWEEHDQDRFQHQGERSFPSHQDQPRMSERMDREMFPQRREHRPQPQHSHQMVDMQQHRSESPIENMPSPREQLLPHNVHPTEQVNTPPPQPAPEINQVNVNKLLQDLQLKGILPTIKSVDPNPLPAPVVEKPAIKEEAPSAAASTSTVVKETEYKPSIEEELLNLQEDTSLPEVDINDLENLKIRHSKIINRIYTGIQCSACGMRFTARQTDVYAEHLDWHYRMNRKDREGHVQSFREFYPNAGGWIMYEEIDDPMKRAASQVFDENMVDEDSKDATNNDDNEELTVPVTGKDDEETCKVCKEPFETIYNEEEEEWQFINCIRVNEETFHPDCYGDHDDDAELNPLPTPVRVPLFNPLNNTENVLRKVEEDESIKPIKFEVQANDVKQETESAKIDPTMSNNVVVKSQTPDTEDEANPQLQIDDDKSEAETSQDEQNGETKAEKEDPAPEEVKKEDDTPTDSNENLNKTANLELVASSEEIPILNNDKNKNMDNLKSTETNLSLDSSQIKEITVNTEKSTSDNKDNSVKTDKDIDTNNESNKTNIDMQPDTK